MPASMVTLMLAFCCRSREAIGGRIDAYLGMTESIDGTTVDMYVEELLDF